MYQSNPPCRILKQYWLLVEDNQKVEHVWQVGSRAGDMTLMFAERFPDTRGASRCLQWGRMELFAFCFLMSTCVNVSFDCVYEGRCDESVLSR